MLFIVQFEDDPSKLDVRQQWLPAHVEFLDRNRDRILVPGSLREPATDRPVGGLWIVDAPDEAAVKALFADDPFWVHGLRAGYRIHRWHKAFPDRRVPI
ncbi:MAG TPA: YciI family protein [Gammaproteobacteria bacterium]